MPPIKVNIDAPLTPKKGLETRNDGQTPSYPAAQPGAPAVPAPTGYVPSPQGLPQPTRTTATSNYGPPPPQPGAVPIPPSQSASLPPPPKAGETPQSARQGSVTTMPPQMGIPPPQQNYTPTRGTMYSPVERTGGTPSTINFGAVPSPAPIQAGSHPPGYQQDLNAQEMSSAARASLDTNERREGLGQGLGLGGGDSTDDAVGNAWNTVKGWATAAGKSLAETEKEVWKRINKD